jgi:hypothetical protein
MLGLASRRYAPYGYIYIYRDVRPTGCIFWAERYVRRARPRVPLAWLGVCVYSYTVSSTTCFFLGRASCARPGRHARLAWLRVRTIWLHMQFLYFYFLRQAACSLSDAAYTLGLASRMPYTDTNSGPQSGFSEPSVACTPSVAACVLSWIAVTCFRSHVKLSICIEFYTSVSSLIRRLGYMKAKHVSSCGALQAPSIYNLVRWQESRKTISG